MVSSSCSTTITVLPKSRRRFSVPSSLWLSRWCRPMDGSSRMYNTPIREEPIWVARRIRWLSPPERVPEARERVRYSSPTLCRKPNRDLISFIMGAAIMLSRSVRARASTNSRASVTDLSHSSLMLRPPTVTPRLSGESLRPWQASQGTALIYPSISSLIQLEEVSLKRRSRLLITPSKGAI